MSDNLLIQTLLIFLVAFFGYLHSVMGSTMWNRPIIMSTLTGLVLGDITTGIKVGGMLELAFLGAVPIGASNPPNMTAGAIIGASFVILSGSNIGSAVALAIPIATLVLLFDNLLMMFVLTWAGHLADKYAAEGNATMVEWVSRGAAIGNKLILASVVALGFYIGVPAVETILGYIPEFILTGMDVAAGVLPAIGFAMLARMILSKDLVPYLIAGFLLAAYLQVDVLGIALFGLVIALVVFHSEGKTEKQMEVYVDDNEF